MSTSTESIVWFRDIFSASRRRSAERIPNAPAAPEPYLDTTLIEHLTAYAATRALPSGMRNQVPFIELLSPGEPIGTPCDEVPVELTRRRL